MSDSGVLILVTIAFIWAAAWFLAGVFFGIWVQRGRKT
jgi:hypothetical protein